MARYGVHAIHRRPDVRCRKLFGICLRRRAWQAWCDCGWDRTYRTREKAETVLYVGHSKTHVTDLGDNDWQ